jgi:hypothetical protein
MKNRSQDYILSFMRDTALIICFIFLFTLSSVAQTPGGPGGTQGGNMGSMPSGGAPGGAGGGMPGGAGGPPGGASVDYAATSKISVVDSIEKLSEDTKAVNVAYSIASGGTLNNNLASGVKITSDVTGPTGINISNSTFTLGGDTGYYTVTKDKDGVPVASLAKSGDKDAYNSVIILNDAAHTSEAAYAKGAGELSLGVGVHNTGDKTMTRIKNAYIWTSGSVRSAVAVKNLSKVVVEDSYIESTGGKTCHKPVTRLLLSTCRSNIIMGGTAFYYNSKIRSFDWGALSTDTGGPNSTYLYAYNVNTLNDGGGYSTYADTNCFVKIFGSEFTSAEMGGVIASNGELSIGSSTDATDEALKYMEGKKLAKDKPSVITAKRNAIMFHLVDSMSPGYADGTSRNATNVGILNVSNSTLSTICDLDSARDYTKDPNATAYGESAHFINHHKGSIIAFRSSNGKVRLTNVQMKPSYNETIGKKVLIHSMLNYDGRGAVYPKDGAEFAGIDIDMKDMKVSGDILHEDYQRKMLLNLEKTEIDGAIVSGTMVNWNSIWKDIKSEHAGEIYNLLAHDTTYKTIWGVRLSLDADSKWTVTGNSSLGSLTIAKGAEIKAAKGNKLTIYKDCKMDNNDVFYDYKTGTIAKELVPGTTYKGVVILVEK